MVATVVSVWTSLESFDFCPIAIDEQESTTIMVSMYVISLRWLLKRLEEESLNVVFFS